MSDSAKSLRIAYGNALYRTHPALDNGDGQSFERHASIGPIYSQSCPPCMTLAKHRVPGVSPSIEFPVTDPGEIKEDGTLKQAHEVAKPRTKWSNARCSATKRHAVQHQRLHEMYASDEAGWKRPPPDYTAADEALELHSAAKRAFCSDASVEELHTYTQKIAQCAADAEQACPRTVADSIAAQHDAELAARLAVSARDAEDESLVLSQMAAQVRDAHIPLLPPSPLNNLCIGICDLYMSAVCCTVSLCAQDAEEDRAGKEATAIRSIVDRAESIMDEHLKEIMKGNQWGAKPPTPTPPWWGLWLTNYGHFGCVCVEAIAMVIVEWEHMDEGPHFAQRVRQAIKESVPNRIEEAARDAQHAARCFRWPSSREAPFFGSTVGAIARWIACPTGTRYGSIGVDAYTIATAAFPYLTNPLRADSRASDLALQASAGSVAAAARAVKISDPAQVKALADGLGFDGEVGEVEPAAPTESPTTSRLTMATVIAELYKEMIATEVAQVVKECRP